MTKKQILTLLCIFLVGCGLLCTASLMKKHRTVIEWDGNPYNLENINALDAKFAQPYNKSFDTLGDVFIVITCVIVSLVIIISFFTSKDKKTAFFTAVYDCFVFLISGIYANSLYRILKTIAGRIRPYMYFANPSVKGIAEGDFYRSWPSGHSANVFIVFAFLLTWYAARKADSKFKKPVLTISLFFCVTTMIFRMLSGNHFLTDVLSGAALGFVISYLISNLCYKIYGGKNDNCN